jgi:hypothetical protein
LTFYWWNPTTQRLESKTLPALTLQVPIPDDSNVAEVGAAKNFPWIAVSALLTIFASLFLERRLFARSFQQLKSKIHSTERGKYQKLLKACRQNNAENAYAAWYQLYRLDQGTLLNSEKIKAAISELEQHLYGTHERQWSGAELARALRQSRRRYPFMNWQLQQYPKYQVPPLNP